MKQFIWILCGIFLSGLLLGSLSGCGAGQTSGVSVTASPSSQETGERDPETGVMPEEDVRPGDPAAPEEEAVPGEESVPEEEAAPAPEDDPWRLAYAKVLEGALFNGVLPDGTQLDYLNMEAAAANDFALFDVDRDGEEELLLCWANAGVAGMLGIVFAYRDGAVYEELREFASLTFYNNGAVEADWSHNQGLGGRFWPFNAYRYDEESGVYESIGGVDAWDISVRDTDYEGNPFPHDIDADGDGLVYYLLPANWNGQYDMGLVDGPDFENWQDIYLDGAEPLSIPWQDLTEENIAALGHPKPLN